MASDRLTTPAPGSVALITGGTGGFGRALAAKLRALDVTVVLADLDSERNRQVAADLGCPFVVLDVTDRAANEAVVAQVEAEHGRLDAAYLNAGISAAKSDDALDLDEFMRVVDDRPVRRRLRRRGRPAGDPAGRRRGDRRDGVPGRARRRWPATPATAWPRAGRSRSSARWRRGWTARASRSPRSAPGFADTAIIDPIREEFEKAGFPVLTAEEVADAMVAAWTSAEPGAAYVIQPGIGAVPYKFKGVPSAKTAAGETAVVPEALRPPSMR